MKKKSITTGTTATLTPAKRTVKSKLAATDSAAFKTETTKAKRATKAGSKPEPKPAKTTAGKSVVAKTGKTTAAETPTVKVAAKAKGHPTLLVVRHNAGWGNTLFLRGEGAGLSWETGVALACVGDNEWVWSATLSAPILFKVLVNDTRWSTGDNHVLAPGETLTLTPSFA